MTIRLIERRADPRRRSLIGGSISVDPEASTTECLLRDVAEGGARLALGETIPLPDSFDLTVAHWRETRRARLVWRRGDAVGVAFAPRRDATAPIPLGLARDLRDTRAQNAALRAKIAAMRNLEK